MAQQKLTLNLEFALKISRLRTKKDIICLRNILISQDHSLPMPEHLVGNAVYIALQGSIDLVLSWQLKKMLADRMNVLEVVAHIRRQRGNMSLLNESFQAELVSLARIEGLLGPRGGEPGSRLPASGPPPRSALDMN